ncbi:MAG: GNAT family N-acetyltransferase [Clostridia bacterium]|nr:GNAT family N-acetyltransferase [Clostridia bacterium]
MNNFSIRAAKRDEASDILGFIKELAEYEKMGDKVVATTELLEKWIFDEGKAEVIFAIEDEKKIGFALYFHNFSTFLGKAGIYLEDLYISPEYRGKGYGKEMLKYLAETAIERGCGRLDWSCLDWNQPSIDFYLSLGAEQLSEWTVYRLEGESLYNMAKE